jgi:ABC-2 type transport system ATP-binding protein
MPEIAIRVESLSKSYGDFKAVKKISFEIAKGSVVGFIGANGAGKTTTMRMLSTLDIQDEGEITVNGFDVISDVMQVRRSLGWMPDHFGKYQHLMVEEYLDFFARSYGFTGRERDERVEGILDFVEMQDFRKNLMNHLSKGLTQRMGLGRALIHDPDILILDEPAAGLDPKARIDLKRLIRILADEGKTLFISSHILSELEEMCDSMIFLDKGEILHQGGSQDLKEDDKAEQKVEVHVHGDLQKLMLWIEEFPYVRLDRELSQGAILILEDSSFDFRQRVLKEMVVADLPVVEFHVLSKKLEDVFVDMLEGQNKP